MQLGLRDFITLPYSMASYTCGSRKVFLPEVFPSQIVLGLNVPGRIGLMENCVDIVWNIRFGSAY